MINTSSLAKIIKGRVVGEKNTNITKISDVLQPEENSVVFLSKKKEIDKLLNCKKCVIVLSEELSQFFDKNFNLIVVENVLISLARTCSFFYEQTYQNFNENFKLDTSNNTFISDLADISPGTKIGKNCIIEDYVKIGDHVSIGHNVVISRGVVIGNNVSIDHGTIIGSEGFGNIRNEDYTWTHIRHIGSVIIGDNVSIGANNTIDRGTINDTILDDGVITDNQVHIAHNVCIGSNTAIAAKTGIAGSCKIGKRNMIGGMVGIVDHITTVDDVVITAKSTVYRNIKKPGTYSGIMPILEHTYWKRISTLITKLDKIAKIAKIKKN